VAFGVPAIICGGWVLVASGVTLGLLPDAGLIPTSCAPDMVKLFGIPMVTVVFAISLYQARATQRATLTAIERSNEAVREALEREGQLEEANQELEVARARQAGHEGKLSGSLAGAWRLGEVLGRGAMGEVYAAVHERTGAGAAVKILQAGLRDQEDFVERFLREGEAAARLETPHVAQLFEVGRTTDGIPYMTMERLKGEDLAARLRHRRKLPLTEVIDLVAQVGQGLVVAHAGGVLHRDIKPQNLFLAERAGAPPIWKILDFGVAKLDTSHGTLTQKQVIGTPGYMAPEQAEGKRIDGRCDLFSLGAVIYRALAGRAPFGGPSLPQLLFEIVYKGPLRPRELDPTIPPDVELVLALALAKRPQDRFATPAELLDALQSASQSRLPGALRRRAHALLAIIPWGTSPEKT
jgi:serine/threonine-protein kinase